MKCLQHTDNDMALTHVIHGATESLPPSHSLALTSNIFHFYLFMRDTMCSEVIAHHWSVTVLSY